ncbi:MAG TPA: TolC family protein [Bacteroidota bacterium]|nr:TolC family protein [Bacteroidota bacterium]
MTQRQFPLNRAVAICIRIIWLVIGMVSASAPAFSQSVDSLLHEAFRNNPQLQSAGYKTDAAESRATAARALPAPTLGIEFSQIPTGSTNIVNEAISNNFSLSQMFMLGGKLSAMSEMETVKGSMLEHTQASLETQLRAKVKMNYIQLWRLDRQIELQQRTIRLLEELAASLQSRVATNRTRTADALTLQSEIESERARLDELTAKRMNAQNTLASLCAPQATTVSAGMRMDDGAARGNGSEQRGSVRALLDVYNAGYPITPDSALPALPPMLSEEELAGTLLDFNPSLQTMEHMKLMNDAEIKVAHKELIPDVMLQAMIMRMPNGMILTSGQRSVLEIQESNMGMPMGKTEWMYSLMASITLPFVPWSSERSSAKADEMRSMNLSVDAEQRAMQREMLSSLRSSMNTYRMQDSLARRYAERVVPLAHDAARAQMVAYQTGQTPLQSVIDAYRMELMKQDDFLMALMNKQMAFIEIEMMVGVPLQ